MVTYLPLVMNSFIIIASLKWLIYFNDNYVPFCQNLSLQYIFKYFWNILFKLKCDKSCLYIFWVISYLYL